MIIDLAGTLGLPLLAGVGLARWIGLSPPGGVRQGPNEFRGVSWAAWLAWCWVLGTLATALVTFVWLWTPLTKTSPAVPAFALVFIGALGWWRGGGTTRLDLGADGPARAGAGEAWVLRLVFLALVLLTVERVVSGASVPIFQNDEAHFWALKSKLIFQAGGLNEAFLASLENPHYLYHRDYPLLNPLLQVWTFANFGEITHVENRLPLQLFSLAFVPLLTSALLRVVRPAAAAALLLIVLACAETAHQARTAHADLLVALGVVLALDAWLRWRSVGANGWFALACVGLALAIFAKGEGLVVLLAIALALLVWRVVGRAQDRESQSAVPATLRAWVLLPLSIVALTWGVNAHFGFVNDIATTDGREESFLAILFGEAGSRVPYFLDWCLYSVLPQRGWTGHLPLVFGALVLLLAPRLRRDDLGIVALALLAVGAGFTLILLGTPHPFGQHLPTAFPRITWQIAPALALWIAAAAGRFLPGYEAGGAPAQ